jgi:hypothetical protein
MKQTIGLSQFQDAFDAIRPNNFSYEGLEQLFNYFESYEQDTNEEIELDVIAICCEYSENTPKEIATYYNIDIEDDGNELLNVMDYLADHTSVIGHTDTTIIYQQF